MKESPIPRLNVVSTDTFCKRMDELEPVINQIMHAKNRQELPIFYAQENASRVAIRPGDGHYTKHYADTQQLIGSALDFMEEQYTAYKKIHSGFKRMAENDRKSISNKPLIERLKWRVNSLFSPQAWLTTKFGVNVSLIEDYREKLAEAYAYLYENKPNKK